MKEFFKREIQEKTTIGRVFVESLIYAAFITGIAIYAISLFSRSEMQVFAKIVKEDPISIYFILLPAVILLVEIITLGLAMFKLPTKTTPAKKKTSKKKTKKN